MRKIFINGKFVTQKITGVQRYALEVLKSIDLLVESSNSIIKNYKFVLLVPKNSNITLKLKNIEIKKIGLFKGVLWEQLDLPFFSRSVFLINFCNSAPVSKRNQLVVIHDVSFIASPQGYKLLFRLWYQFLIPILLKRSMLVVTDSEFSKSEIINFFIINANKIKVIYLGVNQNKSFLKNSNLDKLKPFFLIVSSKNPNKNIPQLLNALKMLDLKDNNVLIVGGKNDAVFNNQHYEKMNHIYEVGYISEAKLIWLYKNASFFIFPSIYEGFGLPPLEAMSYGCPVVASNAASIPEVCGHAALYFDPLSLKDMTKKIESMMNSSSLRDKYSKLGQERSKKFSWNECAKNILLLIDRELRE
jgi:glycosyltransferase involved in cell wall biosynthesis